ncbi:methyltransferase domain-containing protein [Paraburkholderia sp. GAS334]|uniref:methyltransferase domain-containing protein n=1 Tax=Paraburkholderia sp. GAS334 TaxID=3035131 RepID=UPI003D234D16
MSVDSNRPPPQSGVGAGQTVPEFATRDPNSPAFWDERFKSGFMPWDQAGVPSAFTAFAARHAGESVLIPGCGSAWEALVLAQEGRQVRAIDFSPNAVATAREQLGAHGAVVEQADFFSYEPPFTPAWIYERAFLCALPKARWGDYAQRMATLLPAGALLAGFYFLGATPKGPPFGIERPELEALLLPHFELIEDEAVADSVPVFAGRERWMTWRRRGAAVA